MANEATVRSSLTIRSGNTNYRTQNEQFNADVTTPILGPTPGALSVTTSGLVVSFSQLVCPGLCRIQNLSSTYVLEAGIKVTATGKFHPLLELLPGESYVIRFSRNLLSEEDVPGTGTTGDINSFFLRTVGGSGYALVEAFEK